MLALVCVALAGFSVGCTDTIGPDESSSIRFSFDGCNGEDSVRIVWSGGRFIDESDQDRWWKVPINGKGVGIDRFATYRAVILNRAGDTLSEKTAMKSALEGGRPEYFFICR